MQKLALIFDMDGVLLPSEAYNFASYNAYFQNYGFSFEEQDKHFFLGKTVAQMLETIGKRHNIQFDKHDFSQKTAVIQIKLMQEDKLKANPELLQLLTKAKNAGIPLAVGTSSTRERAEKLLAFLKIDHFFSALVTAEDVSRHKPEPDVFLKAAKRLNASPASCVVFEDAPAGVEAAKKAKMKAVGYTAFRKGESATLQLHKAHRCISCFSELSLGSLKKLL